MKGEGNVEARRGVIEACRRMNALGINQGTSGNVSVRVDDGFLITPSGVPYDAMTPEQVVFMDLDGAYAGEFLPSSEWRMHHAIMAGRPDAGAVVHTHAVHCTALSTLRLGIPSFHYMVAVAGGPDIRCSAYATFGTQELCDTMMEAMAGRSACLLANHGMIACGPTLDKALGLAVEVETLARQYLLARQVGEPVLLDAAEIDRVLALIKTYGRQAADLKPGEAPPFILPRKREAA